MKDLLRSDPLGAAEYLAGQVKKDPILVCAAILYTNRVNPTSPNVYLAKIIHDDNWTPAQLGEVGDELTHEVIALMNKIDRSKNPKMASVIKKLSGKKKIWD